MINATREATPQPRAEPAAAATALPPLRRYQVEASAAWAAQGKGILSMATGTGKTVTALECLRLAQRDAGPLGVVLVVPFTHLVDQWAEQVEALGYRCIRCYESASDWSPMASMAVSGLRAKAENTFVLAATLATSATARFRTVAGRLPSDASMLIADEVHHFGSAVQSGILMPAFRYRLGISATPSRWRDQTGTQVLADYFGGTVFEYPIARAIEDGYLVSYEYEPVLVDLDPGELSEYQRVAALIERAAGSMGPGRDNKLAALVSERSAILNAAAGKVAALRDKIQMRPLSNSLFFCASRQQLQIVGQLMHDSAVRARFFTEQEDAQERRQILADFANGTVKAILAIKALDEGVDIPPASEAHILASSSNPAEWIQRRGRVLRTHPGKTVARIVDYAAFPPEPSAVSRKQAEQELRRMLDFAATAGNADRARSMLVPALERLHLLHLIGESI